MKEIIRFKDVDLGYDGIPILTALDFAIKEGDFVGIIGPNGVGKTTLLKGMLGMLSPIRGQITYSKNIKFGYVPQRQSPDDAFPLSVLDVVLMGRWRLIGFGRRAKPRDWQAALTALEQAGVGSLADSLFRDLSGGQKQRVLIARALAGEPNVLILDEPTTDLDVAGQRSIMDLLKRLHDKRNLTVVVASHLLHHVVNYVETIGFVEESTFKLEPIETAVTAENLTRLYGIEVQVGEINGHRFVF
ncbi:MAG: metal ABC transporter ATP-binding protein [Armatimonadetes bacterium]|nr:metal ABC transporter ATP-binding protein [Armatimonadota bacterium]